MKASMRSQTMKNNKRRADLDLRFEAYSAPDT